MHLVGHLHNTLRMLTPLYSHYTLLHASAFKTPSSGSIGTFREQGQQNVCPDIKTAVQL